MSKPQQKHAETASGISAIANLSSVVHTAQAEQAEALNEALLTGYQAHRDDADTKRTHLFHGRYENVYLTLKQVPELAQLLEQANAHAQQVLGIKQIKSGCWINDMPPGAVTTAHRHDDDDELLSGVYYVSVPENSGQLVLHRGAHRDVIQPEAGLFVFFAPNVVHEVTENLSDEHRISIGMNFGSLDDDE